jgi:hypothetical protein
VTSSLRRREIRASRKTIADSNTYNFERAMRTFARALSRMIVASTLAHHGGSEREVLAIRDHIEFAKIQ